MTKPILQSTLPHPPWIDPVRWKLPGIQPLPLEDWLIRDEVYAEQMALRDSLITARERDVHALLPSARPAAEECFDAVLKALQTDPGYTFDGDKVTRPDGVAVVLDANRPLLTLGRLIQADLCLMEKGPEGHILTGAILCFPAYWTLAEKLGRTLPRIHTPVPSYDDDIARRVQRLFDALRPGELLWRANANLHPSSDLFTPKPEHEPEHRVTHDRARFVRSERQVLRKLPKTEVVVFSIHTYMVPIECLPTEARETLRLLD